MIMNKQIIKLLFVIIAMTVFTISLTSCASKRVTTKEYKRTTVLDDQEKPLKEWVDCRICNGKGSCQRCKGTGKVKGVKCVTCDGTGKCAVCGGEGGYRPE